MIERLLVYNDLIEDEVIRDAAAFSLSGDETFRRAVMRRVYPKVGLIPHAFETYIEQAVLSSANRFSLLCEKIGTKALDDSFLVNVVKEDIKIIRGLFEISGKLDFNDGKPGETAGRYLSEGPGDILKYLAEYYYINGCGEPNSSGAYLWDNGIVNVSEPDRVSFDDLIGYEYHKRIIINNTRAFVEDRPFNNILLFGDRGTGKSSCVKAAFNMFKSRRVRIIELSKSCVSQIQDVMKFVRDRGLRFILFLDDLSFEETEYEYKELKAHLEGGLESQPSNVVIYATSNRFHIVRETSQDNLDIKNEIHLNDAIQEKLSLSDRFGITITFDTPNPGQYIDIVEKLLARQGVSADPQKVKTLARRWEIANHGRSGRSAVQFVKAVAGEIDEDTML